MPSQKALHQRILSRTNLDRLMTKLQLGGRTLLGPIEKDGAIVYGAISSSSDLPIGHSDEQAEGYYRIRQRKDEAVFGFAVGPDSWKRYLHPPRRTLWRATRKDGSVKAEPVSEPSKYAFFGVRACELAAIKLLDKVLLDGRFVDAGYARARRNTIIVAVNCSAPSGTCFCSSMQSGPVASNGFDLSLTELIDGDGHRFLVEIASETGEDLMSKVTTRRVKKADREATQRVVMQATQRMGRTLKTERLKESLAENPDHSQWDVIAERCLSCGNCTQVCPSCFCTSVEDHTSLCGEEAERVQTWDSCFTNQFAELSGGQVRETTASRYRQWMTHKLSTWYEQFDTSGCVGCGRCIAWCPVGIDITREAEIIAGSRQAAP